MELPTPPISLAFIHLFDHHSFLLNILLVFTYCAGLLFKLYILLTSGFSLYLYMILSCQALTSHDVSNDLYIKLVSILLPYNIHKFDPHLVNLLPVAFAI